MNVNIVSRHMKTIFRHILMATRDRHLNIVIHHMNELSGHMNIVCRHLNIVSCH